MRKLAAALLVLLGACRGDEEPLIEPGDPEGFVDVAFRIVKVHENRRLTEQPPWHAAGGDWLIAECTIDRHPFLVGMQDDGGEWGQGILLPRGDGEPRKTPRRLTAASCRGGHCVVQEVVTSVKGGYSSADPKKLWLLRPGSEPRELAGPWDAKTVDLRELSPGGRFVALGAMQPRGRRREFVAHVHDLESGRTTTFALPGDSVHFRRWDGDERLLLESGNVWDPATPRAVYRATPRSPAMEKVGVTGAVASPDGARSFVYDADAGTLVIGDRTFTFHPDDRGLASLDTLQWLDGRSILFQGERPALIDADTLKMHELAAPERTGGRVIPSPDGRHVLYSTGEELLFGAIQ